MFNFVQFFALFLALCARPTTCFVRTANRRRTNLLSSLKAKLGVEERSMLSSCQVMVAVPLANVPVNELTNLKKGLPKSSMTSVLPMNDIIQLVDGTPYCIMGSVVTGVNLCIFIANNEDYEYFNTWMKKMTSTQTNNVIACKKGHLIRYK